MTHEAIPGFDPVTGMLSLPWWAVAVIAAFMVACFALAITRIGVVRMAALAGTFAVIALVIGAAVTWIGRSGERDRANERLALEARAFELAARAVTPGSPLACLDGAAGELVETSCEKTLFASPEVVAAATSYVAARIVLLANGLDYALRAKASYEASLPGLRRSLEIDRFGFVAQVLATRYNCSADKCDMLGLFQDPTRLRENLKDRAFDAIVARNSAAWPARAARPATASAAPTATGGASPVPPGFNVPSSSSIPPVSIMTPEAPAGSAGNPPAVANTDPPPGNPPAAPKRRTSAPRAAANTPPASTPPVQIVPPGATAGSAPRTQ
jgi:hypothetical protein